MSQSLLTGGGVGGVMGTVLVQEAKQINVAKIVSSINLAGVSCPAVPRSNCRARRRSCSCVILHKRTAFEKRLAGCDAWVTSPAKCERFILFLIFIFHRGWNGRIRDGHPECDRIGRRRIYDRRNCRAEKAGALRAAAV